MIPLKSLAILIPILHLIGVLAMSVFLFS